MSVENEDLALEIEAVEAILGEAVAVTDIPVPADDPKILLPAAGADDTVAGKTASFSTLPGFSLQLHPLTASEEARKYVSLKMRMWFPPGYPEVSPLVQVSQRPQENFERYSATRLGITMRLCSVAVQTAS